VVWFKARYVNNPDRLNATTKTSQKMNFVHFVRLTQPCQNAKKASKNDKAKFKGLLVMW
jgi:hypothetical protein